MNKEIKISDFSQHLFWDVDPELLNLEENKDFIIPRAIGFGHLEDWYLLRDYYGLNQIKEVSIEAREFDDVTLAFLSRIFDIKVNAFRCYRLRRSNPNYWNY